MESVKTAGSIPFGAPKGWDQDKDGPCGALPVRIEPWGPANRRNHISTWRPSPEELAILNNGGYVEVSLLDLQPPMAVGAVGHHLDSSRRPDVTLSHADEATGLGYDEHGPATP
jgi:hypothetical protein